MRACSLTAANSASVSSAGLSRIRLETPSLPMSCSRAARPRSRSVAASASSASAMLSAITLVRSEWR